MAYGTIDALNPGFSSVSECCLAKECAQPLAVKHKGVVVLKRRVSAIQACGDRKNPGISISEESAYTIPDNPMSDRGQAVVCTVRRKKGKWWNGEEVTETFTTRSIDALAPDRQNFAAVIQTVRRKMK